MIKEGHWLVFEEGCSGLEGLEGSGGDVSYLECLRCCTDVLHCEGLSERRMRIETNNLVKEENTNSGLK